MSQGGTSAQSQGGTSAQSNGGYENGSSDTYCSKKRTRSKPVLGGEIIRIAGCRSLDLIAL